MRIFVAQNMATIRRNIGFTTESVADHAVVARGIFVEKSRRLKSPRILWRSLGEGTSSSKDNGLAQGLGSGPGTVLQCVSGEPPKPKRECAAGRTVTNRFETFRCQACGRNVRRQARQQKFCSDRCRDFARRERDASQINGRIAIKNPVGYQDSVQPTNPLFLSKQISGLQGRKSGSSIPLNVLGGYRWSNAVGIDRDLLRKIFRAEVGGL